MTEEIQYLKALRVVVSKDRPPPLMYKGTSLEVVMSAYRLLLPAVFLEIAKKATGSKVVSFAVLGYATRRWMRTQSQSQILARFDEVINIA